MTRQLARPIFLPRKNGAPEVPVDPGAQTIVSNPALGVTLTIPAATVYIGGTTTLYSGSMSVSSVPPVFTPGALPSWLEPSFVITIQPMGLTFAQPVAVVFPNDAGLAEGTALDIWSMNHATGVFERVGGAMVSAGGQTIASLPGEGVRETSWHFVLPPAPPTTVAAQADGDVHNPERCTVCPEFGSDLVVPSGVLSRRIALPSHVSLGEQRRVELVYRSDRADPRPILPFDSTILQEAAVPPRVSYQPTVSGAKVSGPTYVSTSGLSGSIDETIRAAVQIDGRTLATGVHPVSICSTSEYGSTPGTRPRVSSDVARSAIVVNETASPFGAGWGIAGLQRLYPQNDGGALIADGDGSYARFQTLQQSVSLATTEDLLEVMPPPNVTAAAAGQCDRVQVFREASAIVLPSAVTVDRAQPGTIDSADDLLAAQIPAGTTVSSYLVHYADAPSQGAGAVTFPRQVLGVIVTASQLNASNSLFAPIGTTYPTGLDRGIEFAGTPFQGPDSVVWSSPGTVSVEFNGGVTFIDQIRVVTAANPGDEDDPVLLRDPFDCENEGDAAASWLSFTNFDVPTGFPQLVAVGSGGLDLEVDLDGQGSPPARMVSSEALTLEPGNYVLEFDVTNTGTGGAGNNQMAVSLGSAYSETFALLTGQQIPRVQRAFTVAAQQSAQLVFDHSGIADDGAGLQIDNVLLYRVAGYTSPPGDFSVLARNADGTFTRTLRDGSRVEFDTSGFETALVDRYGNATTFAYSNGRLTSITDVAGRVTTLDYMGSAVMIAHPPSPSPMRETVLMLDSAGDLRDIVLPEGVQWSFEYDQHRMTSEINPRGYVALHDYDFAGRLLAAYPPNGAERIAANGQSVGLVDPASGQGTPANPAPVRRPADAVSGIEDGEGRVTMFETGPLGSTTQVTDAATGLATSIARDAAANPTQVQLPSGHTVIRTFDRGQPATIRDVALNPTGQTTLTYHPKFAEVESITDSLGTWNPVYNGPNDTDGPEGSLQRIESPLGRTTEFEFSQAPLPPEAPRPGLLRAITDRLGTRTELAYDAFGNLAEIRQGVGLGPALERVTTLTHTPEGYVDQITDAEAGLTDFDHDDLGRVVFQTLPGGRGIDLELDDAGNLLGLTPPEGLPRHTFRYDGADREEEYLPPIAFSGARTTRFRYNREDQLLGVDRADSLSVDVAYDASGRVDALETSEGIYDFVYSPMSGLLTSVSAPNAGGSGLAFGYLASSSLPDAVTWSGPVAGTVSWEYDLDGRLDTQTVGGVPLGFGYDADGLLTSAGALTIVRNVQTGFVETASVGSVTTTTGAPNPFGELVVEETTYQSQQPALYRLEIPVRDRLGRILEKRETLAGVETVTEYSYDAAQRLATVTIDGVPTRTWTYDLNSNRQLAGGPVAVYDVQDRLLSLGATTYAYSNHGDLASKTDASGTTTYDFDELGNLHSVDRPAPALPIDYVIDAANRRVGKRVNGVLTKGWLYQDGLRVVAELDGASNVVSRFVYGTKPNVPEYMVQGATTYRIVSDHLGSVRLVVNAATGVVAQRIDYDEWGNATYVTGAPDFQPFGFAGGLHDPDTALVRFGARDYDPATGRWTSKDPIRFSGADVGLYLYAFGDPVNFVDPNGEAAWILAAGAIGAAVNVGMTAFANGGISQLTGPQIAAAAASGFIAGAAGALGGPLGGSVARSLGQASNGWLAAVGAAGISGLAGGVGQAVANCVDPEHTSSVLNAVFWSAFGGGVSKYLFPTRNLNTLQQALRFAPTTVSGLIGSANAWLNLSGFGTAAGVGAAANFPHLSVVP